MDKLKAPFPYFGGKSKVAPLAWSRLGNPSNYIEPFCGSAAMLLLRPDPGRVETINDADCYISNFWRAIQADPDEVAYYADWPVNETDLHPRHRWLAGIEFPTPTVPKRYARNALLVEAYLAGFLGEETTYKKAFICHMKTDPNYYDPKIAGWWCWGMCCWIGAGWCSDQRPVLEGRGIHGQIPDLSGDSGAAGRGIHAIAGPGEKRVKLSGHGVGNGVHRVQLGDTYSRGRGVHANDAAETCLQRREWLKEWFRALQDRLRTVRVCCGDWSRVCSSPSTTTRIGLTGIFLDPPYPRETHKGKRDGDLYATDLAGEKTPEQIRDEVLAYCLDRGDDPMMRIAVCGYAGDGYEALEPKGWIVVHWKTNGGYGNRGDEGNQNKNRERIWFSPHCLKVGLFDNQGPER